MLDFWSFDWDRYGVRDGRAPRGYAIEDIPQAAKVIKAAAYATHSVRNVEDGLNGNFLPVYSRVRSPRAHSFNANQQFEMLRNRHILARLLSGMVFEYSRPVQVEPEDAADYLYDIRLRSDTLEAGQEPIFVLTRTENGRIQECGDSRLPATTITTRLFDEARQYIATQARTFPGGLVPENARRDVSVPTTSAFYSNPRRPQLRIIMDTGELVYFGYNPYGHNRDPVLNNFLDRTFNAIVPFLAHSQATLDPSMPMCAILGALKLLAENTVPARLNNVPEGWCDICLKFWQALEIIRFLRCNHFFHADCVIHYFIQKSNTNPFRVSCPLCNNPFQP